MPRTSRQKSETNFYHIVTRGNNKGKLFFHPSDYKKFLKVLEQKLCEDIHLYAYCLMSNHVHMLIQADYEALSKFMKRLDTTYAMYFNYRYDCVGHVFEDRYKSEPVQSKTHYWNTIRYIHNNPVKAGMVLEAEKYPWSSMKGYYEGNNWLIDRNSSVILHSRFENQQQWIQYHNGYGEYLYLDVEEDTKQMKQLLCEKEIKRLCKRYCLNNIWELRIHTDAMGKFMMKIRNNYHMTYSEIEKYTGIKRLYIKTFFEDQELNH